MPDNPYAAPRTEGSAAPEIATAEELRAIASYQRSLQVCILIQLLGIVVMAVPAIRDSLGPLGLAVVAVYWLAALAGLVFSVLLALRVYNVFLAIVFAIFSIVPCIGLLCLLVINQRATARLQEFQIPVGLMGADMNALEERIQQMQQFGMPPAGMMPPQPMPPQSPPPRV